MAPKKFQKVVIDQRKEMPEKTTKVDHNAEPVEPELPQRQSNYGEHHIFNCGIPYGGFPRSMNCTVNAAELQRGIAKQKDDFAKTVQEHQEFKRAPKGKRVLSKLQSDEADTPDTTRLDH